MDQRQTYDFGFVAIADMGKGLGEVLETEKGKAET